MPKFANFLFKSPANFLPAGFAIMALTMIIQLSACSQEPSTAKQSTQAKQHDHSQHQHGQLEITSLDPNATAPTLNMQIVKDAMSGWNVHIQTEGFRFTPEAINQDATLGQGHAHIFVDGYKIARIYGEWYHLRRLTPGQHTVRITLNADDHSEWAHQGETIAIEQEITQSL